MNEEIFLNNVLDFIKTIVKDLKNIYIQNEDFLYYKNEKIFRICSYAVWFILDENTSIEIIDKEIISKLNNIKEQILKSSEKVIYEEAVIKLNKLGGLKKDNRLKGAIPSADVLSGALSK